MTGAPPLRGQRLIVGLAVVAVLVLPAAYIAVLFGTDGGKPARDLLFLVFYVAIAAMLAANIAIASTLSLTASLATPELPASGRLARLARRDALPPFALIGAMAAPMAILLLGFGGWLSTTLYRAGGSLPFLALTALDLALLSAALLALALLASIGLFHRAKKAAEAEDPNAR